MAELLFMPEKYRQPEGKSNKTNVLLKVAWSSKAKGSAFTKILVLRPRLLLRFSARAFYCLMTSTGTEE